MALIRYYLSYLLLDSSSPWNWMSSSFFFKPPPFCFWVKTSIIGMIFFYLSVCEVNYVKCICDKSRITNVLMIDVNWNWKSDVFRSQWVQIFYWFALEHSCVFKIYFLHIKFHGLKTQKMLFLPVFQLMSDSLTTI